MSIIKLGDEIPAGMAYVGEELAQGRTGLWVGHGPAGFALIIGGRHAVDLGGGKVLAASLTPSGLRKIYDRIGELLGESVKHQTTLPEGLSIGDKPQGDGSGN